MSKDFEMAKRIVLLRELKGLEQTEVAAELAKLGEISYHTYQHYEYGNHPSRRNLALILKYYKCDKSWFLAGEGVPYPKASGPEPSAGPACIKEGLAAYPAAVPAQQFNIMEDLDLAARVLGSGTHYAAALHLNIRSFTGAINDKTEMSKCKDDLHKQGELIEQMQDNLKTLREEILKLKGSGGDSPPIALGMDHAARTGTEGRET